MSRASTAHPAMAIAVLGIAALVLSVDFNIVYVALPEIGRSLGFTDRHLQWVVSGYSVAIGGFQMLGGRACDLLGHRRVFVTSLAFYAVGSLLGGVAAGPAAMIAARFLQGIGGAILFPSTLSLINALFEEGPARNRALAIWGLAGASGLTLGSLLGGVLTSTFGWRSVFLVNLPVAALVIAGALAVIPPDGPRIRARAFDLPGALAITASVLLLVYALIEAAAGWTAPHVLASAAASVACAAAFVTIELRSADPLVPARLARSPSLRGAMILAAIFMATFMTLPYFLTMLLQKAMGFSTLATGLAFLVPAISIAAGTQIGERVVNAGGSRAALLIGLVGGSAGVALLAINVDPSTTYLSLVPAMIVYGLAQGVVWTAMWVEATSGVQPEERGVASGMASTSLQVGGAIGLSVLLTIAQAIPSLVGGIRAALFASALLILAAALLVAFRREPVPQTA